VERCLRAWSQSYFTLELTLVLDQVLNFGVLAAN